MHAFLLACSSLRTVGRPHLFRLPWKKVLISHHLMNHKCTTRYRTKDAVSGRMLLHRRSACGNLNQPSSSSLAVAVVPCLCQSAINRVTLGEEGLDSTHMFRPCLGNGLWKVAVQPCKEPVSDSIMNRWDEARPMFQALFVNSQTRPLAAGPSHHLLEPCNAFFYTLGFGM